MIIPKSFMLFANTINVVFDDTLLSEEGLLGLYELPHSKITLTRTYKGRNLPEDTVIDTFYHEKVHSILDSMGETELSGNEKFVDLFAKLLRQSDNTQIFQ